MGGDAGSRRKTWGSVCADVKEPYGEGTVCARAWTDGEEARHAPLRVPRIL